MRAINFDADTERFSRWLNSVIDEMGSRTPTIGMWFGLVNLQEDRETTADLYAGVSPQFDANSLDWASQITVPTKHPYAGSTVLRAIYANAYTPVDGLENDAEYPLVLALGAIAVCDALRYCESRVELQSLNGAAVGFDGGDFLYLGHISHGKFVVSVRTC
ncbi:MAG: hypothetical protein ABIZ64_05350 [Casimicrobium sp.]